MATKPQTPDEKTSRAEAMKASARQAVADYNDERQRIEDNSARLRTLRLAREAEAAKVAKAAKEVAKKPPAPRKKPSATKTTAR